MEIAEALLDVAALRIPAFIDPDLASEMLRAVRESPESEEGTIIHKTEPRPIVDPDTRRARHVTVASTYREMLRTKFEELMPLLAVRFGKQLTALQNPQFIAYGPGDFFTFHRDKYEKTNEPPHVRARQVSLVLFLSDPRGSGGDGDYEGGTLQFYAHDIVQDPAYKETAISVHGAAGTLVAFEPHVRHQVTPIVAGERVSVVSWFA